MGVWVFHTNIGPSLFVAFVSLGKKRKVALLRFVGIDWFVGSVAHDNGGDQQQSARDMDLGTQRGENGGDRPAFFFFLLLLVDKETSQCGNTSDLHQQLYVSLVVLPRPSRGQFPFVGKQHFVVSRIERKGQNCGGILRPQPHDGGGLWGH